jgi:hypothetical protein
MKVRKKEVNGGIKIHRERISLYVEANGVVEEYSVLWKGLGAHLVEGFRHTPCGTTPMLLLKFCNRSLRTSVPRNDTLPLLTS